MADVACCMPTGPYSSYYRPCPPRDTRGPLIIVLALEGRLAQRDGHVVVLDHMLDLPAHRHDEECQEVAHLYACRCSVQVRKMRNRCAGSPINEALHVIGSAGSLSEGRVRTMK